MRRLLALLLVLAGPLGSFERALPGYVFSFPRDHFSHPNFRTEWWYYTGNLRTAEGRAFGFELTFFRFALGEPREKTSAWQADSVYLAHFALSDLDGGEFFKTERLNRAGPGLAGANLEGARVWNGNWEARWLGVNDPMGGQRLRAIAEDFSIDLMATPQKPAVIHGTNGVSQKAAGAGKASHYVSFTRLGVEGTVSLRGERFDGTGLAWMDHEFSTDSMGEGQVGWDWMSIQFENDTELMLYRMRREDGSTDIYSSGTFVEASGETRHLTSEEFRMTPGRTWESGKSGARYPVEWSVTVVPLGMEFSVATPLESQEVASERRIGPNYWEGAIRVQGSAGGARVRGAGYLEMTGYDRRLSWGEGVE